MNIKTYWIVKGEVSGDSDMLDAHEQAHGVRPWRGAVEWQFSDGPPGKRTSSEDFLSVEAGMKALSPATFHFVDEDDSPPGSVTAIVRLTLPADVIYEGNKLSGGTALDERGCVAHVLQKYAYDEGGMDGDFDVMHVGNTPSFIVEGKDDCDLFCSNGWLTPFVIFHPKSQDTLPGSYASRDEAQIVADFLNGRV
jgi:hypothetical protein